MDFNIFKSVFFFNNACFCKKKKKRFHRIRYSELPILKNVSFDVKFH